MSLYVVAVERGSLVYVARAIAKSNPREVIFLFLLETFTQSHCAAVKVVNYNFSSQRFCGQASNEQMSLGGNKAHH